MEKEKGRDAEARDGDWVDVYVYMRILWID